MKLSLKNFRCYEEKDFDFGTEGLLLLSGPSGAGKSSILHAITFVLYGTGMKVVSFGKTGCMVCLEMDDITITRTKRPNRVVVKIFPNNIYEDDSAQEIINTRFGTAFNITSYVQQNAVNSFILMSPTDKLSFLEKFAFNNIDIDKLKGRCQALLKQKNEELISTVSQLEMANTHLSTLTKPEKVKFPVVTKNKEETIKKEEIRYKNNKILYNRAEKALQTLNTELNDLNILFAKIEGHEQIINTNKTKIKVLKDSINNIEYVGDEDLVKKEELLYNILSQKELILSKEKFESDTQRLHDMQESELEAQRQEIENIKGKMWQEYSQEDVCEMITDYQEIVKDAQKVQQLNISLSGCIVDEKKLEENIKLLKTLKNKITGKKDKLAKLILQQELYTCPNCDVSLKLIEGKLEIIENDSELDKDNNNDDNNLTYMIDLLKKEISDHDKAIARLEALIPSDQNRLKRASEIQKEIEDIQAKYEENICLKDAENNLEYIKEYKRSQIELEKKLAKLESVGCPFSASLEIFKEQLKKQEENIKILSSRVNKKSVHGVRDIKENEEELRVYINTQKNNKEKIDNCTRQILLLENEVETAENNIHTLKDNFCKVYTIVYENISSRLPMLQEDINTKSAEMQAYEQKIELHRGNLEKIEKYKLYKSELAKYNEWVVKIDTLSKAETKLRDEYAAISLFKEKLLEAESLAVMNIVNSINTHAQDYLDTFFPENPIVVRLSPFKENKKKITKPQINLEIDYKGMEADISMLSGGELSRVILAYTLSLSEIFNSPLVLLDECTASLDQELTSTVMEGIKKNFSHRLVIVIAHQVVSGDFDRQILL